MLPLQIITIAVLLMLVTEDLKSRAVHWVLFPALAIVLALLSYLQTHSYRELLEHATVNVLFLAVQLLLVSLYFSFKHKRWVNITASLLGWGDILFLLSLAFYLPVGNYAVFYLASLLSALVIWLLYQQLTRRNSKHIPLAGLQALLFTVCLLVSWIRPQFNLTDDSWLFNLIYR